VAADAAQGTIGAMVNLTLSWDLFIIVFFALVITYTFILGKKESVKIIIATYIAIVAVQGLGNILERLTGYTGDILGYFGLSTAMPTLSIVKLALFIAVIIFLAVRAGFDVAYTKETNPVINGVLTGLFGFATSGLLLSTVLTYVAGVPLLDMSLSKTAALSPVIQQSQMMQIMLLNQDLWFSLPALLLIAVGFLSNR
jgi:hypothetical protein